MLTRIGEIMESNIDHQAFLVDGTRESVLSPEGWQHFRPPGAFVDSARGALNFGNEAIEEILRNGLATDELEHGASAHQEIA
jgi:hypothetical protein